MWTDDEVIDRARTGLSAELERLEVPPDLPATIRRARTRRRTARWLIGGAAVAALAIGLPLALLLPSSAPAPFPAPSGRTLRLADYTVSLPTGFRVTSRSTTSVHAQDGTARIELRLRLGVTGPPPGARRLPSHRWPDLWYVRRGAVRSIYVYLPALGSERRFGSKVAIQAEGRGIPESELAGFFRHRRAILVGTSVP